MHFHRQVPRLLEEEHRSSLQLLERLEHALARGQAGDLQALARPLLRQIDAEVVRHFGFEEDELFPRLRDAGDGDIAALLADEHADIRELCGEIRPLALALAERDLAPPELAAFRRLALELIERMVAHIQKETMGLLPLLEDLLDESVDRELALAYTGG